MAWKRTSLALIMAAAVVGAGSALVVYFNKDFLRALLSSSYRVFTDREAVQNFITSFGVAAPVAFMALQILQVIFAPIPGEATGFIGGYLFRAAEGFLFSS